MIMTAVELQGKKASSENRVIKSTGLLTMGVRQSNENAVKLMCKKNVSKKLRKSDTTEYFSGHGNTLSKPDVDEAEGTF